MALTTDHPVMPVQFLVHEATPAAKENLDRDTVLSTVTINSAKILGMDERVGSLEVGKDSDLCNCSGNSLDVMQQVGVTFSRGSQIYIYHYTRFRGICRALTPQY